MTGGIAESLHVRLGYSIQNDSSTHCIWLGYTGSVAPPVRPSRDTFHQRVQQHLETLAMIRTSQRAHHYELATLRVFADVAEE